jgi:intein/homing endonuclease
MKFKLKREKPDSEYFNNIDTEKKAYLLGFFIADGCMTIEHGLSHKRSPNYRFSILNSIDDLEIIKEFNKEVCPNSNISYLSYQYDKVKRKDQCRIRWSSKEMFKNLTDIYQIKERKTKDLDFKFPFEKIPEQLIKHFIRGFFDGDGNITYHKYKKSMQFNFSFCGTSLNFMNQICDIFEKLDPNITRTIRAIKGKNLICYQVRFNFNRKRAEIIKKIYDWFYKDSTIFLSRKKIKFENYFQHRANLIDNTIKQCNA